jgi:N-methylhydantoinase A/oxoprolinase/acetone carboxylase beta subunit
VLDGLRRCAGGGPGSLAHGTTLVTNAIVERRGAPVGLITTRGFKDVLEIARQNRSHLYRLDLPAKPEPLVPRHRRLEITERVGPDGTVSSTGRRRKARRALRRGVEASRSACSTPMPIRRTSRR